MPEYPELESLALNAIAEANKKYQETKVGVEITDSVLEEWYDSFQLCDRDGNNQITNDEVVFVLQALGQNPTQQEVNMMIEKVDKSEKEGGDGRINWSEFVFCLIISEKYRLDPKDELDKAFKVFDLNQDGYIHPDEIKKVMKKLDPEMMQDEIDELFRMADINKDGRIDRKEFVDLLTTI